MADPIIENTALVAALSELARQMVAQIISEFRRSRSEGTPDRVIIENIKTQLKAPIGPMANIRKDFISKNIISQRGVFRTASTLSSAAIDLGESIGVVLPKSQGYNYDLDNRARRIYNLGGPTDNAEILARRNQALKRMKDVPLMWLAVFRNTCRDCQSLSGQVRSKSEWERTGILPGNGRTICQASCQCHLAPTARIASRFGIDPNDADADKKIQDRLGNGIKLQRRKIDELEKIRGAPFSQATRSQMLGRVRTERFNPDHIDRESLFIKNEPKSLGKKFLANAKKDS